jgi:hypothetical protein
MYDRSFSIFATHAADAGRPFANYQHNPQKPLPADRERRVGWARASR